MKNEIYKKLLCIQSELKAPKGQYNDYGKYKYRSCEDIFEALKPLLKEHKLVLQTNDELVNLGERYYIKATATLIDEDGTSVSNTGYAREEETKKGMDGSQITGACSSYARKYALNGLFLIDDTKDSDSTSEGEELTEEDILKMAKEYKFGGTKHPNQTIEEVYKMGDKNFLQWCLDSGKDENVKKYITLLTDLKPKDIPATEGEQLLKLQLMGELKELVDKLGKNWEDIHNYYHHTDLQEYTYAEMKGLKEMLCKSKK